MTEPLCGGPSKCRVCAGAAARKQNDSSLPAGAVTWTAIMCILIVIAVVLT